MIDLIRQIFRIQMYKKKKVRQLRSEKTKRKLPLPILGCHQSEGCSFSKRNDKVKQHYRSIVLRHNQTVLPLGQKEKRYLEASSMVQNHTDHARLKGATLIKL